MKLRHLIWLTAFLLTPVSVSAQGLNTTQLDQVMGRSGKKIGDIYKFGFPRTDLHVTIRGIAIKPGLALGSWAAFSGNDENAIVMGDMVLLQREVNPVMARLRHSGFEITALHNHLLGETPRVMYMHYMGHGKAEDLARSLKDGLSASKTPLGKKSVAAIQNLPEPAFVKKVEGILGRKGNFSNGVLGFGIPRQETVSLDGITLPPAMGVAEGINFQEAGPDSVATTGDFVLIADEVNPVISALEEHHIQVTALHTHMLTEEPRLFFMHFWGVGSADSIASGIQDALTKVEVKPEKE